MKRPEIDLRAAAVASWPFIVLGALYAYIRADAFSGVAALVYRDTASYLEVAGRSLLSLHFWAGARPWSLPLLYKFVPDHPQALANAQLVVSIICWLALAAAVARSLNNRVYRVIGFAAVLGFSMSFAVIRWDLVLLSESLSISLSVLLVAAWLELVRQPRAATVIGVLVVSLLWVFTRDTNSYLIPLTAIPAAVWAWRPGERGRRWPLILTGGLLAMAVLSVAATGTKEGKLRRTERPLLHVVGRRVLEIPAQERYFREHGMPRPTPLVVRQRKRLAGIGDGIPSDPATDRFLAWVRAHAKGTLGRYLLTHPGAAIRPVIRSRQLLLSGVDAVRYRSPDRDEQPILHGRLARAFFPARVLFVGLGLIAALALTGLAALLGRARRVWLVPAGLVALQAPHAFLVYHGDTLEIARHAIVMAIMTRLGIMLMILFAAQGLLEWALERRRTAQKAGDTTPEMRPAGRPQGANPA